MKSPFYGGSYNEKFKKIKLENIFVSSITEFELKYGVQKSLHFERNLKVLEEFLGYLNILQFVSKEPRSYLKNPQMISTDRIFSCTETEN
ncbi:PIN domain protein [Leptospira santarosai]|uniref:PIN domain protein n=1 Tax=Leptospira santarosai TaxID=28183 RepID=A0A2P1QV10_9LEPT|nr:PIN domain protein [Leptospira santarosai]